jgi:hypothetical protein
MRGNRAFVASVLFTLCALALTAPAQGTPRILAASASPTVIHNGGLVLWKVHTTADVVAVEAHVNFYKLNLQREGPGRFGLSFQLPSGVPSSFHGTYHVQVTARDGSGATDSRTFTMIFQ